MTPRVARQSRVSKAPDAAPNQHFAIVEGFDNRWVLFLSVGWLCAVDLNAVGVAGESAEVFEVAGEHGAAGFCGGDDDGIDC